MRTGSSLGRVRQLLGHASIDERNRLHIYALWLSTGRLRDRKKHAETCRCVRQQVRSAKDAWFQRKAAEAEIGRHGGRLVWRCIRDIQRGRRGLVLHGMRMAVCVPPLSRGRQHFTIQQHNYRQPYTSQAYSAL